jgi:hypothetical protein
MKKVYFNLTFFILSILTSFALANSEGTLPPDMQVVDRYLGSPDWHQSFGEPQTLDASFVEVLEKGSGSAIPYRVHSELIEQNTVKISNLDKSGKMTSSYNLQNSEWQSHHGNWIRFFIEQTESYGYNVKVNQITKSEEQVQVNGSQITVDTLQVQTLAKNQLGWELIQTYVITNKLHGVGQLLLREEIQNVYGRNVQRSHRVLKIQEGMK